MTDERANLPSASSFDIVAHCPGMPALKATLPDNIIDVSDEFAEMGTRIHKARETGNSADLTEEERDIYLRGMENEKRIRYQWSADRQINLQNNTISEFTEKRIWLHWPDLEPATSARLDVHYVGHEEVLCVEWKTLWCSTLTPAEKNWQGRVQAVCARNEYGAKHVRVAFNKAMFGKSDVVDYNESDLAYTEQSIFQRLWEAKQPGAQRVPGNWCNYCPCKQVCREAGAYALIPSKLGMNPVEIVDSLPLEDVATIHRKALVIGKVLAAVKDRLKATPAEILATVGLKVNDGRRLDPIKNTEKALSLLKAFSAENKVSFDIYTTIDIKKGALVDQVRQATGWTKKQTEEYLWTKLLSECIEKKRSEGSLEEL